ncbi:Signal transduction histidine kinase [hydrothermal vent metagenome]|uniref:Signal transduction histidine kinase n=1 Tax=hydrothermal vent metagenome TaxID=652676 RepID=A0A3B1D2E4_9ZZZZ
MQEKPKILIVDDRTSNLFVLETTLKGLDVQIIRALSGNEALKQTLHQEFALILLDVQMPGMNGYEVANLLREEEKTRDVPIIFITAIDRQEQRELEGYDVGAVDYIFKPINTQILLSKVKVFIQLYKNQFELKTLLEKLKKTQAQLLQSEKLASIGQLAAGIAHEINNPVGFINNNLELIREYSVSYEKILDSVENLKGSIEEEDLIKAKECVKQLATMEEEVNLNFIKESFKDLLADSVEGVERVKKIVMDLRTSVHCDEEKVEEVKMEEVIEGVISIIWNELKYHVELKKEYGNIPLVKCNPQRLGQVFMNLLLNASQAIKEKGEIGIKTYCDDQYVYVNVTDTGEGIPKEDFGKVFDAFYTTKPIGKGTGLGLSVSYEIIHKHNGEITFDSEVGKGTSFTVKLPIDGGH